MAPEYTVQNTAAAIGYYGFNQILSHRLELKVYRHVMSCGLPIRGRWLGRVGSRIASLRFISGTSANWFCIITSLKRKAKRRPDGSTDRLLEAAVWPGGQAWTGTTMKVI